jgi:multidrug efflux pump subunit AcrA (membrane-fusion protein)
MIPNCFRSAALFAVLALVLVTTACSSEEVAPFGTGEVTVEDVAQVISSPATVVSRTYPANVVAAARADVTAPVAATLTSLVVADGDEVAAGDVLAVLRSDMTTGALRQAEAAVVSARTAQRAAQDALARTESRPPSDPLTHDTRIGEIEAELAELRNDIAEYRSDRDEFRLPIALQREQALLTEYDAWVRQVDQVTSANAALRQAEQALAQARRGIAELTLTAPVAGVVRLGLDLVGGGGRAIVVGADVAPGQAVVTVTTTDGFRIELSIPEADLAPVVEGVRVVIDLEAYPAAPLAGTVSRIADARPGPDGRTAFVAEVALDATPANVTLRAGLTGTATLPSLAFDERFEVRLDVDEIDVVLVEVGQRVDLEVDALRGTPLQGTIVAIGRAPERAATGGTVYRTRVRLDTPDDELPLRGGLTGTADVEVRRLVGQLTVPSTALLRRGGGEVVYVVRDGVAVEVAVRVLAFGETRVAITVDADALRAGDRVVTTGLERVTAGAVVEVG